MNLLILIQDEGLPSSRVRGHNLVPELKKNGINATCKQIPKGTLQRLKLFKSCKEYDIVLLQRKLFSLSHLLPLRFFSKKVIFDFDDAIYLKDASLTADASNPKHWTSLSRYIKFWFTIKIADLVIAGNSYLKQEVLKHTKKVDIIPSAVPYRKDITPCHDYSTNKRPVIGWVGTQGNQKFLRLVENSLAKIADNYSFTL